MFRFTFRSKAFLSKEQNWKRISKENNWCHGIHCLNSTCSQSKLNNAWFPYLINICIFYNYLMFTFQIFLHNPLSPHSQSFSLSSSFPFPLGNLQISLKLMLTSFCQALFTFLKVFQIHLLLYLEPKTPRST